MIKANFIQVSVTNRMVQLVSSDLAPHFISLAVPDKRETLSQKSPSNTQCRIDIKPEVCRNTCSITFEKTEQTYSWQIQEVLSKPVLRFLLKL